VSPSSTATIPAAGTINASGDAITIELVEPPNHPPVVRLVWPAQPTITDPKRLNITINAVMTILARASTRHAAIRAKRI
jgi:hypothetical protein